MKKSRLLALQVKSVVSASFLLANSITYAAPISELTLTGGSVSMGGVVSTINPAAFASMSVDGSYDGSAPTGPASEAAYYATSIATYTFGFFGPAAVYTAEFDGRGNGPYPGVTGDLTGSGLTLDLSSWTWWWKEATNLGSANVTSTVDADGNFSAAWDATVVGGPFNGITASWIIAGHVSAIPIPASTWLLGSGLIGLIGVARRKKSLRS